MSCRPSERDVVSCGAGIYGDQVNEMSWAVGEVLNVLRELGIDRDTLVLFMSDHGPHREIGHEGGSTGPFAGNCSSYLVPVFVEFETARLADLGPRLYLIAKYWQTW